MPRSLQQALRSLRRRAFFGGDDSTGAYQGVLLRPDLSGSNRWIIGEAVDRPAPEENENGGVLYDANQFAQTRLQGIRSLLSGGELPVTLRILSVCESNWQHVAAFFDRSGQPTTRARSWRDSEAKVLLEAATKQFGWAVRPGLMVMKAKFERDKNSDAFERSSHYWNTQTIGTQQWCGQPFMSASEAMAQGWRWKINLLTGEVTLDQADLCWVDDRFPAMLAPIVGPGRYAATIGEQILSDLEEYSRFFTYDCGIVPGLSDNTATAVATNGFTLTGGNSICGISNGHTDTKKMPGALMPGVLITPTVPANGSLLPFGGPTGNLQYLFCLSNGAVRTDEYADGAAVRLHGNQKPANVTQAKQWRKEVFRKFEGRFLTDSAPLRSGITCIPFSDAESFPMWPDSIMEWQGIKPHTLETDFECYRLLLDSLLYNATNGVEMMTECGIDTSTIRVAGGMFQSTAVKQELADITGRNVIGLATPHLLAAKGAALYALWVHLRHNGCPDLQLNEVVQHFYETDGDAISPRSEFHKLHQIRRREFNARLDHLKG